MPPAPARAIPARLRPFDPDNPAVARLIWELKYRSGDEASIEATLWRVAGAVACGSASLQRAFYGLMARGEFMPGGRILAGAAAEGGGMLLNCFVAGRPSRGRSQSAHNMAEIAETLAMGGGVGVDLSNVPPASERYGAPAGSCGPVDWLHGLERVCRSRLGGLFDRSALLAALDVSHPDIGMLCHPATIASLPRQISIAVTIGDDFLRAIRLDVHWPLVFRGAAAGGIRAQTLWRSLQLAALATGSPSFIFKDRIARENNLWWMEAITACNPCGEAPLPDHGACLLGSLNVSRFVERPFADDAGIDVRRLRRAVRGAVSFLDMALDRTRFPLPAQRELAHRTRRIGLGVTGLADALILLGLRYETEPARRAAARIMEIIRDEAYAHSVRRSALLGPFPAFRSREFLEGRFVRRLSASVRERMGQVGVRNSHLLALAPTGSISLLLGGVSSGVEPVTQACERRSIPLPGGGRLSTQVTCTALIRWRRRHGGGLPPAFVSRREIAPEAQLAMVDSLQAFVDQGVSKTIALPHNAQPEDMERLMTAAAGSSVKGLAVFADRSRLVMPASC